MKKALVLLLCGVLLFTMLAACGQSSSPPSSTTSGASADEATGLDPNIEATLTIANWNQEAIQLYDELGLEERFQKLYPNVTIELEEMKNDIEYFNAMRIRASANELPDIFFNLPHTLAEFKPYMHELNDLSVTKDNVLAEGDAIDGKIYGLPEKRQEEYVLFWRPMFEEAGVDVPKTWPEFIATAEKLQQYFGAENPDFAAISMGAKDEWPAYLFSENIPSVINGRGQYWNEMVEIDEPFAEGEDINTAFHMSQEIYNKGVFGKDPLGIGYDQALTLFAEKQASMETDSPIGVSILRQNEWDLEGMEAFFLPYRQTEDEPLYVPVRGGFYMSISQDAENVDLAKAFLEFYFGSDWYPDFIEGQASQSTMASVTKEMDPILQSAYDNSPEITLYNYDGGNEDFVALSNAVQFDFKKLGAEMFIPGFDLDARLAEWDAAWKAARAELGYS